MVYKDSDNNGSSRGGRGNNHNSNGSRGGSNRGSRGASRGGSSTNANGNGTDSSSRGRGRGGRGNTTGGRGGRGGANSGSSASNGNSRGNHQNGNGRGRGRNIAAPTPPTPKLPALGGGGGGISKKGGAAALDWEDDEFSRGSGNEACYDGDWGEIGEEYGSEEDAQWGSSWPEVRSLNAGAGVNSTTTSTPPKRWQGQGGPGWKHAPPVNLGKVTRDSVENVISAHTIWNPHGIVPTKAAKQKAINDLVRAGFHRDHATEATSLCKDREEALEWLLFHLPEKTLPEWALPGKYTAGAEISLPSRQREELIVREMTAAGYDPGRCAGAIKMYAGNEDLAAEHLQNTLMRREHLEEWIPKPYDANGCDEEWFTDSEAMSAMYEDRCEGIPSGIYSVRLENSAKFPDLRIVFRRPGSRYPTSPPVVFILAEGLPAYVQRRIVREVLTAAEIEQQQGAEGNRVQCIYGWLEAWIEDGNLEKVLAHPGSLLDVYMSAAPVGRDVKEAERMGARKNTPRPVRALDWTPNNPLSARIKDEWTKKQTSPQQLKMIRDRQTLPAWAKAEEIVQTVNKFQVTIISGETGSGKSTQAVSFVLDHMIQSGFGAAANIVCTQPRRISALGLADRVSDERCGVVGEEVGYAIRGDAKMKRGTTKITFMTTGVLLQRMKSYQGNKDGLLDSLADVSHVFIDEVHERSRDTDMLMALLKDILQRRPSLKLVLMSATLDAGFFADYFGGLSKVGLVGIQGRTFPVEDFHLEQIIRDTEFEKNFHANRGLPNWADEVLKRLTADADQTINYDLIAHVVSHIDAELTEKGEQGSILIFLPGAMEIERTCDAVASLSSRYWTIPLHAGLEPAQQKEAFKTAPTGRRKVVAATNIAETSITISDCLAVIDTGRVKENLYDPRRKLSVLMEVWASRAACKQRRGRAGRVKAGKCYKLFTKKTESDVMAERPEPEIRRTPLEQLVLMVKGMECIPDTEQFLAGLISPPDSTAVDAAIAILHDVGALENGFLTGLGKHLAMIATDLKLAKLLVLGSAFGCLESCLTIAAILSAHSPFMKGFKEQWEAIRAAKKKLDKGHGDVILDMLAFDEWSKSGRDRSFAAQNFLSIKTLHEIASNRTQFTSSLKEIGLIPSTYHSRNPSSTAQFNTRNAEYTLLRALIAGSFNPNFARVGFPKTVYAPSASGAVEQAYDPKQLRYFSSMNARVFVHPSNLFSFNPHFPNEAKFVSFFETLATGAVGNERTYIQNVTPINAFTLLLFGGDIQVQTVEQGILVNGWLMLKGWPRIGVLVTRLRSLFDEVLGRKIERPEYEIGETGVVDVVAGLMRMNGQDL